MGQEQRLDHFHTLFGFSYTINHPHTHTLQNCSEILSDEIMLSCQDKHVQTHVLPVI